MEEPLNWLVQVQHVKATSKSRTYEGRAEGMYVVVEIPKEHFTGSAPAEMYVTVSNKH